jgi:hypothetical protein
MIIGWVDVGTSEYGGDLLDFIKSTENCRKTDLLRKGHELQRSSGT